jgi:hypothetical protein
MVYLALATPGAEACDAGGGALRLQRREWHLRKISSVRNFGRPGYFYEWPDRRLHEPFLESQGTSFTGARQNVAFCPVGLSTVTWQSYSPSGS